MRKVRSERAPVKVSALSCVAAEDLHPGAGMLTGFPPGQPCKAAAQGGDGPTDVPTSIPTEHSRHNSQHSSSSEKSSGTDGTVTSSGSTPEKMDMPQALTEVQGSVSEECALKTHSEDTMRKVRSTRTERPGRTSTLWIARSTSGTTVLNPELVGFEKQSSKMT